MTPASTCLIVVLLDAQHILDVRLQSRVVFFRWKQMRREQRVLDQRAILGKGQRVDKAHVPGLRRAKIEQRGQLRIEEWSIGFDLPAAEVLVEVVVVLIVRHCEEAEADEATRLKHAVLRALRRPRSLGCSAATASVGHTSSQ